MKYSHSSLQDSIQLEDINNKESFDQFVLLYNLDNPEWEKQHAA